MFVQILSTKNYHPQNLNIIANHVRKQQCLRINPTKDTHELHTFVTRLEQSILFRFPKFSSNINKIPIKIPEYFFLIRKLNLKFTWTQKFQGPRILKKIMKKKSKVGRWYYDIFSFTIKLQDIREWDSTSRVDQFSVTHQN